MMKDSLYALTYFNHIENISAITSGLSQTCFKIYADNNVYFAKTISGNTEVYMALSAAKAGLSPTVIYHDEHWLITDFIHAENLALSTINTDDKIDHAIKLMVQCHQLNATPAELVPTDIINELINKTHYSTIQKTELLQLAELILPTLNNTKNQVCCHGDLNFSNVLTNKEQATWLVDYECACTASIEFDLAMFIAVNILAKDKITIIIKQYESQSSVKVDPQLLNHYLLFCYFINALWYFSAYEKEAHTENKQALLKHAKKQLLAINSPLFSRLGIKLTNILTTLDLGNQA